MTYPQNRAGSGRWCVIQKPAAGVLWTDDAECVGFVPAPNIDPAPVDAALETAFDAGRTAPQAFYELAALVGSRIIEGNLDNWKPNRNRSAARR